MASALSVAAGPRVAVPKDMVGALGDVVGPQHVLTAPDALEPYGKDETHGLTPVLPDVVVSPGNAGEVAHVAALCARFGVPLTPRGAGSGRSGGCVPVRGGVVMAFGRMQRIVEFHAGDGLVVVEPGVILETLHKEVERQGFFYPPDPASLGYCTLGGNVAENAGGPRAVKYGVTRDYVLGAHVVLADGSPLRVGRRTHKGVAGYDLTALLCGSEGTLALITQLTLKVIPNPRVVETAVMVFKRASDAADAVTAILKAGISPRTLEYVDELTIQAVRPMGGYRFPDHAVAALIVETDGNSQDAVFQELMRAADVANAHGAFDVLVAQDPAQRASIWATRHNLSAATRRITGLKVSEDVVVPRSRVTEMVARVGALGQKHGLVTCAFGHAGDGNLHVQVIFEDKVKQKDAVEACMKDVGEACIALGGSVSGEHGVGVVKMDLLTLEQGPEVIALQKRVKAAFDPAGILNPGKIFR
jgi:glycolate oxidase